MKIDVAMELAKNEIINSINEVSERYGLPPYLLDVIMQAIANETKRMSEEQLVKNMEEHKKNIETQKESKKKESDK